MAKKFWDGEVKMSTDWGGDASTNNLPLSGKRVQEFIKESINSKVGYLGEVKEMADGTKLPTAFYVLCRDEECFNSYKQTVTSDNPFGDLTSDGIMGRFDAPSNYTMKIDVFEPEGGYKSALASSTGNVIRFKAETQDKSGAPQQEGVTVTYRIKNSSGIETSQSVIYSYNQISAGVTYNLDGKISVGENVITITVVGENTGISSMRRITYNLLDMYFNDRFDIAKRYAFDPTGVLSIPVGYDLKGVGETTIYFYFDGNLKKEYKIDNENPLINNANENFIFTIHDEWMGLGLHTLQMYMKCVDSETKEEFFTPIYYREFVVESSVYELEIPYITRKLSFDKSKGILAKGENPTIYDVKQFENLIISYAVYYRAKGSCKVETYVEYPGKDEMMVSSEDLPLVKDNFSAIETQEFTLAENGPTKVYIRAFYGEDAYVEASTNVEVEESDMKITTSEEGVVLYLNAFGRSNNSDDKAALETWEYRYLNVLGQEEVISTTFSKNEYVVVSTKDINGNVIKPNGVFEDNCLEVSTLPTEENEDYDFLIYNNEYYAWNREFDWSNTSGWADGKLKLANGNAITINYKPFDEDKLETLKLQGGTLEFEFETTNVYDDNAVICRICGNNNFAPGISIYAAGAELAISRDIITDEKNENAGYAKMVSTKYKSEESNRISFVITPDGDVNGDGTEYRNRILKIYVNGELCGAYAYDKGANFYNDSDITFRGGKDAGINISSIKLYKRALSSTEILNNYIYYRTDSKEKTDLYESNDIVSAADTEQFDADKLKSSIPVMTFYQIFEDEKIEDLHQEKKDKKLTRHFDVLYIDTQNPSKNFFVKCAYITPQGTSSMNYPVKNFRLYTTKDSRTQLYVGAEIFLDGNPANRDASNLNPEALVPKGKYAFKDGSIPVKCWCLKADFAESSSSHNTGTARYWNEVLVNAGYTTKAQRKAKENGFEGDVRTTIDGFPIVLFYERMGGKAPEFQGKYNFNNDKSTEDVFGFTGGDEIETQEVKYFYIGNEKPIIQYDKKKEEYACSFEEGGYTETPTVDSPLYVSDADGKWYMLRGKELLDNPKMECWELLNSVNDLALFKTAKSFTVGDDDEKVGLELESGFDGAFESRYPDCGDYYHTNTLRRFAEWLISCRYLTIDNETGAAVPFTQAMLPVENYHLDSDGKLIIQSLTKRNGTFKLDYPNYNFYTEVSYESISSEITKDGYAVVEIDDDDIESIIAKPVDEIPTEKIEGFEYLICNERYYTWKLSNTLYTDILPEAEQANYKFIAIGASDDKENAKYYIWKNTFDFSLYYEAQHVEDNAFNRALKFAVEKYDHIEMDKMAAYYIYLMRFGGVDQTVKNSMLTTEGPNSDDPNSTLPSLWYFINYDNDTILGVKNDGRLVFDPYITRETKDGTGYVYAGRESTLWNNLEADIEFMEHVTAVDNNLASSTGSSLYTLSYANALREYDTNQSDKWCQRIYNKDAETKYINTYVNGWVQKVAESGTTTHVYEDYLYDVQGSRSAHRKWWLGRRFNVFDSRFANANFRKSLIKFRSTNLPAGSSFTIKSGEPVYYAWGHDNAITEMTKTALLAGESKTFTTTSAFNIGSYLELMGAANIATFDLRNCVGALTEIDVTGCYSASVGTKMKEILIGDHTRTDLINNGTAMKFSGLESASKLEVLDVTNIKNIDKLDGLNKLLNIRNVYAKGTSVSNFTFADGCHIKYLELPSSTETLSLTRSSMIQYANIVSEDPTYANLYNLTIDNCKNLMKDQKFVMNWLAVKKQRGEINRVNINLQGIEWKFNNTNIEQLFNFEGIGKNALSSLNIRGTIEISDYLTIDYIERLKNIFGDECFNEGAAVYIKAPTGLYLSRPNKIYEGDGDIRINITAVGITLEGDLSVNATVTETINGESEIKNILATDGVITMDDTNIKRGYITVNVRESDNVYTYLNITASYRDAKNQLRETVNIPLSKRLYPSSVEATSLKNSYSDIYPNILTAVYTPSSINDVDLEGRGIFSVHWTFVSGTTGYQNAVFLTDVDKENAYIVTPDGFDGKVRVRVTVTRNYDETELCYGEKEIEFKNPNTIITDLSNPQIYNILVDAGIIKVDETGFGKMTKSDASNVTIEQLIKEDGKSIFYGHDEITGFTEFQYFTNSTVGQMPQEGNDSLILIPDEFFGGCKNMTEIAFSRNFAYTGKGMFKGCEKLEHVYGPESGYDEEKNVIYAPLSFKTVGDEMCSGCKKLKTFKLSNTTTHIGDKAFNECEGLEEFTIPSTSDLEVVYTTNTNPFMNCPNITFNGTTYDVNSSVKCQVKDGAVYEVTKDRVSLIHLGKNTKISDIVSDREIYACAYSMEYHVENDVVIPENIVFNGVRILQFADGNSIKFNTVIGDRLATRLLSNATYKEIFFDDSEIKIPNECCIDCKQLLVMTLPLSVKIVGNNAFSGCESLKEITIPEDVTNLDWGWVLDCKNLETVYMLPTIPPIFGNQEEIVQAVGKTYIYVKGDSYDAYVKKFPKQKQHFKLLTLPTKGHVNIIENAQYYYIDDIDVQTDIVTVGGIPTVQHNDSYFEFITDGTVQNYDIVRNGEKIGEYVYDYMTLYLGDNLSCYSGKGIDFTKGSYNAAQLQKMGVLKQNDGNWEYNDYFKGFKTPETKDKINTTFNATFDFSNYLDDEGNLRIAYGQLSEQSFDYVYVHTGGTNHSYNNPNNIFKSEGVMGETEIIIPHDKLSGDIPTKLHFEWRKDSGKDVLMDAFWIREVGNPIFNNPEYPADKVKTISITLTTDNGQPTNVLNGSNVTITDGKNFNKKFVWNGEEITIVLPKNNIYTISANDIQYNYKNYFAPEIIEVNTNNEVIEPIVLVFETIPVGVYPLNNDGTFDETIIEGKTYYGVLNSSLDYDIYIYKDVFNSVWSKSDVIDNDLIYTNENELLTNNICGYDNTEKIYEKLGSGATIVSTVRNSKLLGGTIKWFLPSFYELSMMIDIDEVIETLISIGGTNLFGHTTWTSNVADEYNAWCYADGNASKGGRTFPGEYRMIGKKIL